MSGEKSCFDRVTTRSAVSLNFHGTEWKEWEITRKSTSFYGFFFFSFFSLSPPCAPLPSLRSTSEQMNLRIGYSRSFFVDAIDLIHYYCLLKSTNRDTYNMHFYLTSLIFTGTPSFLFFEQEDYLGWNSEFFAELFQSVALFDKSLSPSFFHSSSTTTTLSDMSFFFFFLFQKEINSKRRRFYKGTRMKIRRNISSNDN